MVTPTDKILSAASHFKDAVETAMHTNPAISEIIRQLEVAAKQDVLMSRTSLTARQKGFYAGRADAKRHLISVLLQTKV